MNLFIYDQTFEGLITAIYDAIDFKIVPDKIISAKSFQEDLFATKYYIMADSVKFNHIWETVRKKTNENNCQRIYKAYLSEISDIEASIYNYIKLIIETPFNVETDFTNDAIIRINNAQKKVGKEAQRVIMFVRFQKTTDEIYYASIDPQYDVISLTINHFRNRYANQKWVIFDTRRKYGYFYDLNKVHEITIENQKINSKTGNVNENILHTEEKLFQELWSNYYDSITIKDRKNLKVHMQFLPKKYWKFLPEKSFKSKIKVG